MKRTELIALRLNTIKTWKDRLKELSLTDIAKRSGVSRTAIYNILNGKAIPSEPTFNNIERALYDKDFNKGKGE